MSDDDFSLSWETFKFFVINPRNLALWLPAFGLAVLLRVITHKWEHQLIFPICKGSTYSDILADTDFTLSRLLYHPCGILCCCRSRPSRPW